MGKEKHNDFRLSQNVKKVQSHSAEKSLNESTI